MSMEKLLRLVPRFCQAIENRMTGTPGVEVSANFAKTRTNPTVIDQHNPAIKLVL